MADRLASAARRVRGMDVIDDASGLEELRVEWDLLCGENGWPMQRHGWSQACAEAFVEDGRLRVLALRDGDALIGVAPLAEEPGHRRALVLLGVPELFEPTDLMSSDPAALALLAKTLARAGVVAVLKRTPAVSPTPAALRRAYRGRGAVAMQATQAAPYITLDPGWSDPESKLSSRRRSDLRRAARRAEALGSVTAELHSPSEHELAPLLAEAIAVEGAGWKARASTAVIADQRMSRFFAAWSPRMARDGRLRIAFLRIDGRAVAAQIAVECANRLWLIKIGYDETVAACSPGTLLLAHTIAEAAKRGLESVELLGQVEPWTHVWTQDAHPMISARAFPATAGGVAEVARTASIVAKRNSRLVDNVT